MVDLRQEIKDRGENLQKESVSLRLIEKTRREGELMEGVVPIQDRGKEHGIRVYLGGWLGGIRNLTVEYHREEHFHKVCQVRGSGTQSHTEMHFRRERYELKTMKNSPV